MKILRFGKKAVILITVLAILVSLPRIPVYGMTGASAAATLLLSEDVLDPEAITERELSSGIVQVLVGYLFEDASFDIWYTAPGFAVNGSTVVTGTDTARFFDLCQQVNAERGDNYRYLGIDLTDMETVSENIVYRIYAGGEDLLAAARISGQLGNELFTVLSVEGLLKNSFGILDTGPEDGEALYVVGVLSGAVEPGHFFTGTDFVEQITAFDGDESGNRRSFTANSGEYFTACPIVTEKGALVGVVEQYSADGHGTALTATAFEEYLKTLDVSYDTVVPVKEVVDLTGLTAAIAKADEVDRSQLRRADEEAFSLVYEMAAAVRDDPEIKQADADAAEKELLDAVGIAEAAKKKRNIWSIIMVAMLSLMAVLACVYVVGFFIRKGHIGNSTGPKDDEIPSSAKIEKKPLWREQLKRKQAKKRFVSEPVSNGRDAVTDSGETSGFEGMGKYPSKADIGTAVLGGSGTESPGGDAPTQYLGGQDIPILHLDSTGEEIAVRRTPFLVGKSSKAMLHIPNETVSRQHFEITEEDGKYYAKDLGSLNHTAINDVRLKEGQRYRIRNGDTIIASDEKITVIFRKEA